MTSKISNDIDGSYYRDSQRSFLKRCIDVIMDGKNQPKANNEIFLLANVHCIPSIIPLFEVLLETLEICPENMFVSAKSYSRMDSVEAVLIALGITMLPCRDPKHDEIYPEVAEPRLSDLCEIAHRAAQTRKRPVRYILLDGSGALTATWFEKFEAPTIDVISIQQTTSGFRKIPVRSQIPMINVAQSATKRHLESQVIARGILRKLHTLEHKEECRFGIVGLGAIGKALSHLLVERQRKVRFFDPHIENGEMQLPIPQAEKQGQLFHLSDMILGCTGINWISLPAFDAISGNSRMFVSCSSEDIEYRNLIQHRTSLQEQLVAAYQTVQVESRKTHVQHQIHNGGFPINFDRNKEWEGDKEILLTRGLVLLGILQAIKFPIEQSYKNPIMMKPEYQKQLVELWLAHCGAHIDDYNFGEIDISSKDWYQDYSIGYYHDG